MTKSVSSYLKTIFQETRSSSAAIAHFMCKFRPDVEFVEIGIDRDHVHLHLIIPPKYAVSAIVRDIKSNTSKRHYQCATTSLLERGRAKFGFLEKVYWGTRSVWSKGFFVSTVGVDEQTIRNYVKWQGQEDNGQAKLEF